MNIQEYSAASRASSEVLLENYKREFFKKVDDAYTTFAIAHGLSTEIKIEIFLGRLGSTPHDLKTFIEQLGYRVESKVKPDCVVLTISNPYWNS